ncbi:hypothetical protein NDU88_006739 [Pleurodeles waltl]|uniref:Uncharacterized protein n=1 Tax=Pleurodeles waltl TaxID=8319 RepID=A0AAV7PS45_PLEWA|nr:hypothetical protein NDU88_006739 [Pleurodeles waltl]
MFNRTEDIPALRTVPTERTGCRESAAPPRLHHPSSEPALYLLLCSFFPRVSGRMGLTQSTPHGGPPTFRGHVAPLRAPGPS